MAQWRTLLEFHHTQVNNLLEFKMAKVLLMVESEISLTTNATINQKISLKACIHTNGNGNMHSFMCRKLWHVYDKRIQRTYEKFFRHAQMLGVSLTSTLVATHDGVEIDNN